MTPLQSNSVPQFSETLLKTVTSRQLPAYSNMLVKEIMDCRAKNFLAVDFEDLKRRRAQGFVELRKQSRSEQVSKRRILLGQTSPTESSSSQHIHTLLLSHDPRLSTSSDLDQVTFLSETIKSPPDSLLLNLAINALRHLITSGYEAILSKTIECGLAPLLVDLLSDSSDALVYSSLWCITNISAGAHELVAKVMEAGVLLALPALLESPSVEMKDQAVWTLCNIAGDCTKYRDAIINLGFPETVRKLMDLPDCERLMPSIVWLFANICRFQPLPTQEIIQMSLEVALRCFETCTKPLALSDACSICEKATFSGRSDTIDQVFALNLPSFLVKLTRGIDRKVGIEALKAYGNLLLGTEEQTDRVLEGGALELFETLLETQAEEVRKEVMWGLSNVAAGEVQQAKRLAQHRIFSKLLDELSCPTLSIKREALIAIANLGSKHDLSITHILLSSNVLPRLLDALEIPDCYLQQTLIQGLGCILRLCLAYEELEEGARRFEELGGLGKLERLASTESSQVYREVESLLSELYGHTTTQAEETSAFSFS